MNSERLNGIEYRINNTELFGVAEKELVNELINEIRFLKGSMQVIYNISSKDKGLDMKETTKIYCIARDNK